MPRLDAGRGRITEPPVGRQLRRRPVVKEPAALLAADDLLAGSHVHRGRGGDFHMTPGADVMLQCHHGRVPFAGEKALEAVQ